MLDGYYTAVLDSDVPATPRVSLPEAAPHASSSAHPATTTDGNTALANMELNRVLRAHGLPAGVRILGSENPSGAGAR